MVLERLQNLPESAESMETATAGKKFLNSMAGKNTMAAAGVAVIGGIGLGIVGVVLGQASPDKATIVPTQQMEATANQRLP